MSTLKVLLIFLLLTISYRYNSCQQHSINDLFINRTRPRTDIITPITTRTPPDNQNSIDDLLKINQDSRKEAEVAVQAFSESISACKANVSCDQANKQFFEVESKLKVAASAWDRNKENQRRANSIMDRARSIIASLRNELISQIEGFTKKSIETSVQNTAIAVKATAHALTHCQLLVNVTCSECPEAPNRPLEIKFPESSRMINEIRANISSTLSAR